MPKPFYAEGVYVCEINGQGMSETTTKKPQFVLQFKVLGTPDPDNPENYLRVPQQYQRSYYKVITQKTIDYFVEDLQALGFTGSQFRELDPTTPGYCNFTGKLVDMYCKHGANEKGEPREEWSVARFNAGAPADIKPLEPAKMRELDNLFGKALKGAPKKPAAAPVGVSDPLNLSDNDMPNF